MNTQTRLTRSATEKVLGGVCGGLGEYFGVDPVLVRLIFVALIFAGGISVLIYPVLWLIMPSATGRPAVADGLQEMQDVGSRVADQVGEGAQALRQRMQAAFAGTGTQPRFDPQTGQPLATAPRSNRVLGWALLGVGTLILANLIIPHGSGVVFAMLLLFGGLYLLRRNP